MRLQVSSPCPMSWEGLIGNDRVRYCNLCKLKVYNLAEMSRQEVARIVRKTKGRLCGRLYLRGDHTATLRDCPKGRLRSQMKTALTVGASLLLPLMAWFFRTQVEVDRAQAPPLVRQVLDWIDPKPQPKPFSGTTVTFTPSVTMGIVCPRSDPPTPPASPTPSSAPQ